MAKIVEAIGRYKSGALTCVEAACLLGMSERHFRRLRHAYAEGGAEAIIDRRRGKPASNKVEERIKDWVAEQYMTRYFDFTPKHFHEDLKKRGFDYGYTWTKSVLYLRGVLKPAKERRAPQEAAALALAWHAGVPGRFDPRLVLGASVAVRPDRHARRRDVTGASTPPGAEDPARYPGPIDALTGLLGRSGSGCGFQRRFPGFPAKYLGRTAVQQVEDAVAQGSAVPVHPCGA